MMGPRAPKVPQELRIQGREIREPYPGGICPWIQACRIPLSHRCRLGLGSPPKLLPIRALRISKTRNLGSRSFGISLRLVERHLSKIGTCLGRNPSNFLIISGLGVGVTMDL